MAAMAAVLEEPPLHPGHALRVEIALQLGGQTELSEHVASRGPVELGTRQIRDQQGDLATLQFVLQIEHEPRVAGQPGQVVHGNGGHLAGGKRGESAPGSRREPRWHPTGGRPSRRSRGPAHRAAGAPGRRPPASRRRCRPRSLPCSCGARRSGAWPPVHVRSVRPTRQGSSGRSSPTPGRPATGGHRDWPPRRHRPAIPPAAGAPRPRCGWPAPSSTRASSPVQPSGHRLAGRWSPARRGPSEMAAAADGSRVLKAWSSISAIATRTDPAGGRNPSEPLRERPTRSRSRVVVSPALPEVLWVL